MLYNKQIRMKNRDNRLRSKLPKRNGQPFVRTGNIGILHAVRNDGVDFLAIVPSPPQLIFQLYTFSTGGEG